MYIKPVYCLLPIGACALFFLISWCMCIYSKVVLEQVLSVPFASSYWHRTRTHCRYWSYCDWAQRLSWAGTRWRVSWVVNYKFATTLACQNVMPLDDNKEWISSTRHYGINFITSVRGGNGHFRWGQDPNMHVSLERNLVVPNNKWKSTTCVTFW